ncbi:ABC transporter permease [Ahrensia kielensis]|uniref:ABC transporter permease n=1 Tax=Ahrensia kielensis TaxID=76980 RepID=A0ABU9T648_9HYPH
MKFVATEILPDQAPPPRPPRQWNSARISGNILMLFWTVAGIGLIWFLFTSWDPAKFDKYGIKYWTGLQTTLTLVAVSIALGAIISLPIAFGRLSKNKIIGALSFSYVYIFRGTPLLVQVFLIYYGLGTFRAELDALGIWIFFRDAWNCAILAFTLNTAAYQAEILRGAIQSVPKGQWEGADSLGIPRWKTFQKIILPQALIVALRPYGNEIILMVKGSAIVALVTVFDLMGETRRAYSRTFDFQMYIWAAVFYFVIVEVLRNIWNGLELRLTRHLKR